MSQIIDHDRLWQDAGEQAWQLAASVAEKNPEMVSTAALCLFLAVYIVAGAAFLYGFWHTLRFGTWLIDCIMKPLLRWAESENRR